MQRRTSVASVVALLAATAMVAVVGVPQAGATPPAISGVAAGWAHTCALTSTGGVKCWGYNGLGQLGDGTTTNRTTPVNVSGLASGVAAIAAGGNHTCALKTSGGVKCWGGNGFGGIGDGTRVDRWTPVDVSGLTAGATAIAAGAFHTCAVLITGGAKCWGSNDLGQLGDGTNTDRLTPVSVVGLAGATSITAGGKQTCVVTPSAGAKCWGHNLWGQLGDGTNTDRSTPASVSGLTATTALTAGGQHTCGLTSGGGSKCWGHNHLGQVGDGTGLDRNAPVDVVGLTSGVSNVAGGRWHTCAVGSGGSVKCWGDLEGTGATTDPHFLLPVDITGLGSGAVSLAAGEGHTCAVMTSGGVKCFGSNGSGQLGNGTTTGGMTPVDVAFGDLMASSTTLAASPNPSTVGEAVTFSATVSPGSGTAAPTGTVSFEEGTTTLGTADLSNGRASFTTASLAAGSHTVTAVYAGDASYAGSTSPPLTQVVGVPKLSVSDVVVTEGDSGSTAATFTVTLSEASSATVVVRARTVDGTATAPDDYAAADVKVKFAPGQTAKAVTVSVVGDTIIEPDETFALKLRAPTNATIADGTGKGKIQNDD